jgi:oligoendopeptidase F
VLAGLADAMGCDPVPAAEKAAGPEKNRVAELVCRLREMDVLIRTTPWRPEPGEGDWDWFLAVKRARPEKPSGCRKTQDLKKEERLLIRRYFQLVPDDAGRSDGTAQGRYLSRAFRKAGWLRQAQCWQDRRADLDQVFDALLRVRHLLAQAWGFDSYAAYLAHAGRNETWLPKSFTALAARQFRPLQKRFHAYRKDLLGLHKLRPFDMNTRSPCAADMSFWKDKVEAVLANIHPGFADSFATMVRSGLIDADDRRNGHGICHQLWHSRTPYLSISLKPTLEALMSGIHEIGHGIHILAASARNLPFHRKISPMAGELAALTFELLALPHLGPFHTSSLDHARAQRKHLERVISVFATASAVSCFEKEIYLGRPCSKGRRRIFIELMTPCLCGIDYTGYEPILENWYHRIPTLVSFPGYFTNYTPAQAGALVIRHKTGQDPAALSRVIRFMRLGSSCPTRELYMRAGADPEDIHSTELKDRLERDILELYKTAPPS